MHIEYIEARRVASPSDAIAQIGPQQCSPFSDHAHAVRIVVMRTSESFRVPCLHVGDISTGFAP